MDARIESGHDVWGSLAGPLPIVMAGLDPAIHGTARSPCLPPAPPPATGRRALSMDGGRFLG